jgi:nucleotide-binding universal stress UspA family protein
MPISTMLVPVSLDDRDERVLKFACGLSVQSVKRVIVATSVRETGLEAPVFAAEVDRARERLAAMAAPLRGDCGMEIELRVVTGDPTDAILALVQQTGVDVICLGTHGKSMAHYLFRGSISEDLFSSGRVRAMAVRHELLDSADDPGELARGFGKRLVVATDFSEAAKRAFLSAFDRPVEAIGELHILHVGEDLSEEAARARLDRLVEQAGERGVKAIAVLRSGDPAQATLDYLDEIDATGVITGQSGHGSALKQFVFGWVPLRLLREAPCPVVVQP